LKGKLDINKSERARYSETENKLYHEKKSEGGKPDPSSYEAQRKIRTAAVQKY